MPSMELTKTEIQALGLQDSVKNSEILTSLAEIAAYLNCSISTVRRIIKNFGLPATRYGLGKYLTSKTLVDKWIMEGHLDLVIKHDWDLKETHLNKLTEMQKRINVQLLRTYG